jgi:hypothetical protein
MKKIKGENWDIQAMFVLRRALPKDFDVEE